MRDIQLLLDEVQNTPELVGQSAPAQGIRRRWLIAGIALACIGVISARFVPHGPDLSGYRLTPFATEPGEENSPAWSPDGRTLAFEFEVDGIKQIYVRSVDAPSGTRLTYARANCILPFWSADASRVYYVSSNRLWSVSTAGGTPQEIANDVLSASLSPDGKAMALARGISGNSTLWIASPSDAAPRRYELPPFSSPLAIVNPPQFSPDGSKIAVPISVRTAAAEGELWIVPLSSGTPSRAPVRISTLSTRENRISWMPDSRHIVISIFGRLCMIDIHGGEPSLVLPNTLPQSQPAVSPDGRRIAFAAGSRDSDIVEVEFAGLVSKTILATSRREEAPTWSSSGAQYAYVTDATGNDEIWLRNAADGSARPLVQHDPAYFWSALARPRFSPDRQHVAYDIYGSRHVVAIASVAGGPRVMLDTESPDQHSPSWSPDGSWIAYRRLNNSKWELVKRPLGNGNAVRLDDAKEGSGETAWSPSGEWICHSDENGLRLVSADGSRHLTIRSPGTPVFAFSLDSQVLYAIKKTPGSKGEIVTFEIPSGRELRTASLDFPLAATIAGLSLNPNGKSFITSVAIPRFDIWMLEGFARPQSWFLFARP